jgi:hypothetical protein
VRKVELARKQVTLYLDEKIYEQFKDLLAPKPVSPEVEKMMVKMIEEIKGGEYKPAETTDYKELEKEQVKLTKKLQSLEKMLGDEYEKVRRVTLRCGFSEDTLNFTPEIVKCINATYDGPPENVHIYIQAMEIIKEKRNVENTLTEIRTQG